MNKTCTQCNESKTHAEFSKRSSRPDGLTPWCKPCISLKRKTYSKGSRHGEPDLTSEQKKTVYTAVIQRMNNLGITSNRTTSEMLDRVGEL